ncbi:MAG: tRNA (adenosine(37)-N6)-threonylcarbamoyltransferase complex ATPase subunit type 1 TsaE [Dermatophilaceae bacterium]|nr:tRNA (adenosine(37)-N6)-threonylcarbamoyltransferase complex ATPase subunit type 1 TsaE [Dermatophilaceae bacterium]
MPTTTPEPGSGQARRVQLRTVDDTRAWGVRLGASLRAGDLLVLGGGLGAGKTTLTQGIAQGLQVRGPITSPTFVIARVHPSLAGGPDLVHVDAYRLDGLAELDDLDLDTSLETAVTVVEWGHGVAEQLSEDYLELTLSGHDTRTVNLVGHGLRWNAVDAAVVLDNLVSLP